MRKRLAAVGALAAAAVLALPSAADASVTQLSVDSVTLNPDGVTATATGTITCSPTAPPGSEHVTVVVKQGTAQLGSGSSQPFQCTGSPQQYTAVLSERGLHAGAATYTASATGTAGVLNAFGSVTIS